MGNATGALELETTGTEALAYGVAGSVLPLALVVLGVVALALAARVALEALRTRRAERAELERTERERVAAWARLGGGPDLWELSDRHAARSAARERRTERAGSLAHAGGSDTYADARGVRWPIPATVAPQDVI